MHRKTLLDLLHSYCPNDTVESSMKNETIDFVEKNEDCFKRELLIGHVTGSAWIIEKDRKKVLLMHHKKLNQWFQPGGHCDGDSDVLNVAMKEANEETGLKNLKVFSQEIFDIDVHEIPERKGIPAHKHYDIRFLIEADSDEKLEINEESNDLAWVSLEKVVEHNNSDSIMRMVRKSK